MGVGDFCAWNRPVEGMFEVVCPFAKIIGERNVLLDGMHDDVVHDDGSAFRNFQIFDYHVLYDVDEHVIVFSKS